MGNMTMIDDVARFILDGLGQFGHAQRTQLHRIAAELFQLADHRHQRAAPGEQIGLRGAAFRIFAIIAQQPLHPPVCIAADEVEAGPVHDGRRQGGGSHHGRLCASAWVNQILPG